MALSDYIPNFLKNATAGQSPDQLAPTPAPEPTPDESQPSAVNAPSTGVVSSPAIPVPQPMPDSSMMPTQRTLMTENGTEKMTEATHYDPNDVKSLGDAYNKKLVADQEAAKADAQQQIAKADALQGAADNAKASADAMAQHHAENQAAAQDKLDAISKLTDDLGQSSTIDPNRLFGNMNTQGKILAGLSLGLGSLSYAAGGKNTGLEILQNAVQQDIDAQKATYENKVQHVKAAGQGFTQYMDLLHDKDAAEAAEYNRQLDFAKMNIQALEARGVPDQLKAKLDQISAGIAETQAQNNLKIHSSVTKSAQSTKQVPVQTGLTREELMKEHGLENSEFEGKAYSQPGADKFREHQLEIKNTQDSINTLKEVRKFKGRKLDPALAAKVGPAIAQLRGYMVSGIMGANRITGQELDLTNDTIGNLDPTRIVQYDPRTDAAIDAIEHKVNKSYSDEAKIAGYGKPKIPFKPNK